MKRILIFLVISTFFLNVGNAQSEFKKEWETKLSFNPVFRTYNHDLSLVLAGDMKQLEMLDGKSGKTLWKFDAKKALDVKSLTNWSMMGSAEGEPVKVSYKKSKTDSVTTAFLNSKTGEILNSITEASLKTIKKQPIKFNSKAIYATICRDEVSNTTVELAFNYKNKLFNSKAMGSGSSVDIEVNATGGNNWSTVVTAKALRHLCTELLPKGEPEMMMNVIAKEGKVFVITEEITVLDLSTGKELWKTTFDNVTSGILLTSVHQEIGRSAFPVADKGAAYVCDFSKGEKVVKKLDINTGNLIWKTDKLNASDIVNKMVVVGNSLIVKFGGVIREEKFFNSNGQTPSHSIVRYVYEGDSDIRAYDITTGKMLWNSDKFAKDDKFIKSVSSMLMEDGKIYACGQKNFFVVNSLDGQMISKTDYGSKDIAEASFIFSDNGNIIVEGKEGVASFSKLGKKNFSVSTDKNIYSDFAGDAYIVWTGKSEMELNEFVRVDLTNGQILGKLKGCYHPKFNDNGDYFLQFEDKMITKYKTSK